MRFNLPFGVIAFFLFAFANNVLAQPCDSGFSGQFPCELIDQIARVSIEEFESEEANDIWGWTSLSTGREYALIGLRDGSGFVDISSPEYPIYLGKLPTATINSLWRDIKVIGNFAYIGSEAADHGLQVFDLRKLESLDADNIPVIFEADANYTGFGNSHNIVANPSQNFIYAVGTGTFAGGPHVVDVSNPYNPVFAGSSEMAGYTHDAQVITYDGPDTDYIGREICVGFNENRVVFYDVTNLDDIEVISQPTYEDVGYTHQGWFTEDRRYILQNDETDETTFGLNTRTIIWDVQDLDNPVVMAYTNFGNPSIDHNLYIKNDMVYESNYTSGLRIFDLLEVDAGTMMPFGFYDVYPESDNPQYDGTWSNYPYFDSGVLVVSSMATGLHLLKPRFFAIDTDVLKVCDENTANLGIEINRRIFGEVNYAVEMEDNPALNPIITDPISDGAPAMKTVFWEGLNVLEPGSYPGEVVINYGDNEVRLPFVLIKDGDEPTAAAASLINPNGQTFDSQLVEFSFNDVQAGYAILQVALDNLFSDIVYQENLYGSNGNVSAQMPFNLTTYFWRIVKPTACGDDLFSNVQTFTIDAVLSAGASKKEAAFALYPNPATDQLFLNFDGQAQKQIEILDVTGRRVLKVTASANVGIDISRLSPGVYIVREGSKGYGKKFVKQ